MPHRVRRRRFEHLVDQAVERLPGRFRGRMRNLVISVEDLPSREDIEELGIPRDELLGVFRGVPAEEQDGFFDLPPPLPDEIVLFQSNLEAICGSEEELIEEIRETIVHECGHYFGLSDEEMESLDH